MRKLRYLFYSHDGFGLGHARRNNIIARALVDADPSASVTLVTGVEARPLVACCTGDGRGPRADAVNDSHGGYPSLDMNSEEAASSEPFRSQSDDSSVIQPLREHFRSLNVAKTLFPESYDDQVSEI
jgi:hypothetical protein